MADRDNRAETPSPQQGPRAFDHGRNVTMPRQAQGAPRQPWPPQARPAPQTPLARGLAGKGSQPTPGPTSQADGRRANQAASVAGAAEGTKVSKEGVLSGIRSCLGVRSSYIKHPMTSPVWKAWKPLLTIPLAVLAWVLIVVVIMVGLNASGMMSFQEMGDGADAISTTAQQDLFFSPFGTILMMGGIAAMSAGLLVGLWASRERPARTLVSVFGRFRVGLFARALAIAVAWTVVVIAAEVALANGGIPEIRPLGAQPWVVGMLFALLPLQCLAEELVFRGYVFQTAVCWSPPKVAFPLALVIETALFTMGHDYDLSGLLAIAATGLSYGWLTERTGGLESSTALHCANNGIVFLSMYLGMSGASSVVEPVIDIVSAITLPVAFALLASRKGWLNDAAVAEAAARPCAMFSSQRDRMMWDRIEEEQLAEWRSYVGGMEDVTATPVSWPTDEAIAEAVYDDQPIALGDDTAGIVSGVAIPQGCPAAVPQGDRPDYGMPQLRWQAKAPDATPDITGSVPVPVPIPVPVADPDPAPGSVPAGPPAVANPDGRDAPQPPAQAAGTRQAPSHRNPDAAGDRGNDGDGSDGDGSDDPGGPGGHKYTPNGPIPDLNSLIG